MISVEAYRAAIGRFYGKAKRKDKFPSFKTSSMAFLKNIECTIYLDDDCIFDACDSNCDSSNGLLLPIDGGLYLYRPVGSHLPEEGQQRCTNVNAT